MAHTRQDKDRLISRVRRIKGQVEAVEAALTQDRDCSFVLQLIAACRGAIGGLMSEVVNEHIRNHVLDNEGDSKQQRVEAAEDLIDVLKPYLK
jgi:DNA-binding FrmR family transcriptional regulator